MATQDALREAREIAKRYRIIIKSDQHEHIARGMEMPGVVVRGNTVNGCVTRITRKFASVISKYLESGRRPPRPASEGIRDRRIRIRLTRLEKQLLETKAKQSGAAGISEYVRAVALSK
jgi:ssDNA-binding replication factor A large subunit